MCWSTQDHDYKLLTATCQAHCTPQTETCHLDLNRYLVGQLGAGILKETREDGVSAAHKATLGGHAHILEFLGQVHKDPCCELLMLSY